jgi:hypothetical protein
MTGSLFEQQQVRAEPQPLPGVDPIRALRWLLKKLRRRHGMRCVDLREEKNDAGLQPPTVVA